MKHGYTKDDLISFETLIKDDWEDGSLPHLLHLCGGNEEKLIAIFDEAQDGDWFFFSHRNHYHSLLAGIPKLQVWSNIHDGGSMFSFSREKRVFSSAILAGNCGIAVGVAMVLKAQGSPNRVWCFLGDGAEEQGHFYEAVLYVTGHDLPVEFIIEDNNIQVDTSKEVRRGMTQGLLDSWPCVRRYHYTPTYPHAGSGIQTKIVFKERSK